MARKISKFSSIDAKDIVRDKSDEIAISAGCRFNWETACFPVWWIERHCKLYEGEQAGEPLVLRGCHQCYREPDIPLDWERAKPVYYRRLKDHILCVFAKHSIDWQFDATIRLFGWQLFSEKWGRWVRRFRNAIIFVPKKNKKSPTLAAWATYNFAGDGELGQKVYLCAKDGSQAREIAGKHVIEMVYRSPELSEECVINLNMCQVTHVSSRSIIKPLSSHDKRSQKSKEGLNGSIFVDEVHVVDREFMSRVSRAGISRSEPLQVEVSTAGTDIESYGKERFDYALQVINGERKDDIRTLGIIYAMPQTLTESQFAEDPVKYGKMANPSWGHTIDPEEFLHDWQQSRGNISKFGEFIMYRGNVWQRAANPWISSLMWGQCSQKFSEAELCGKTCYAGLDLSRTQDMSSLALFFPGEPAYLLTYFWLPEAVVERLSHVLPLKSWVKHGHLLSTPGDVIDYTFIKFKFRELAQKFNIVEIGYDPHYAEEITQTLEQGQLSPTGELIEEGTGVKRFAFKQTLMEFTKPSKEFERQILSKAIKHNDQPVMNWQVGHVAVYSDANQNIRPIKPKQGDIKKIDGVISAIIAIGTYLQSSLCKEDWYSPGMLK